MRSETPWSQLSFFLLLALPTSPGIASASGNQEGASFETQESVKLPPAIPGQVDFRTQIQPILEGTCTGCHGSIVAMGGLRLDTRKDLLKGGDSGPAVIPGRSSDSRLVHMTAGVGKLTMPLEGDPLSNEQVGILRAWIDQGAPWLDNAHSRLLSSNAQPNHWSFQAIHDPSPPPVQNVFWVHNPIDNFVLARLEQEGLEPSPEANRATLIRRLYLDLLGLPPNTSALRQFLNDPRPYAYERLVNRVLASPHFGERWGRHWLDLARYADSDGFEKDRRRPHAWRYREWVINAYNQDLPYDQFVLEQLAGDLLPGAREEQRVATGFHRNTTLVIWGGEFGRTPLGENRVGNKPNTGRDHHPFAFSMLMAGGGVKGDQVVGRTDDIGWNPVEDPIHINDFHATILHLFGLDHTSLIHRFQGRDFRLTDVGGKVVKKLLA